MVIAYWSISPSYIKYMICTLTLCKETNCGKFISVYLHLYLYRDMYYKTSLHFQRRCTEGKRKRRTISSDTRSYIGMYVGHWMTSLCWCHWMTSLCGCHWMTSLCGCHWMTSLCGCHWMTSLCWYHWLTLIAVHTRITAILLLAASLAVHEAYKYG